MPGFWGLDATNDYARNADPGPRARHPVRPQTDASSWEPAFTWRFPPSRLIQVDIDPRRDRPELPGGDRRRSRYRPGGRRDRGHSHQHPFRPRLPRRAAGHHHRGPRGRLRGGQGTRAGAGEFPLRPQRILADLRAALPADAVLVTDVGWNKNGVAQCYELPAEGRFITPGGASTMGFGPAAAVGVQIRRPRTGGGGPGRRRRHERPAAGASRWRLSRGCPSSSW